MERTPAARRRAGQTQRAKGRPAAWTEERGALCRATREGSGLRRPGGERGKHSEPRGAPLPGLRSEAPFAERRGKTAGPGGPAANGEALERESTISGGGRRGGG